VVQVQTRPAQRHDVPFAAWARQYSRVHLDLGSGDGTFVVRTARSDADLGVVGIDTCLDHLRGAIRHYPANARFFRSDARSLPDTFNGCFDRVSINFPYGSLLEAILNVDRQLQAEITRVTRDRAEIEVIVNESALAGLCIEFDAGRELVRRFGEGLTGFRTSTSEMTAADLKNFPSAWSRKLGYGRQPRAIRLAGRKP
jgi:16S rRNA (adenine(1408)-N(1))-methyltransferase